MYKRQGIDKVYSTEYQRTQLTAKPTADALNQPIQGYNPSDLKGLAKALKENDQGKTVLVVGHSNSTPSLVNALLGKEQFPMIEESEYGHLFAVTITHEGKVEVLDLKY